MIQGFPFSCFKDFKAIPKFWITAKKREWCRILICKYGENSFFLCVFGGLNSNFFHALKLPKAMKQFLITQKLRKLLFNR